MSATQELIAAALTAADKMDEMAMSFCSSIHPNSDDLREACARAMVQPAAPEGWQVVPKEPTTEMCRAGLAERHDDLAKSIYAAMLAAAPAPAPAKVPMPDIAGELFDGKRVCDEADVRTYGDAREAAGYARGLAAGRKDAERYRRPLAELVAVKDIKVRSEACWPGDPEIPVLMREYSTRKDAAWIEARAALRGEVKP